MEVARGFLDEGASWIHVVDLDAAKTGVQAHLSVLEKISNLGIKVQFGGGIRTLDSAKSALHAGAARVVSGTALATNEDFRKEFLALGSKVAAGVDVLDDEVRISGWSESSKVSLSSFLKTLENDGARLVILTDISRDGMLQGPNLQMLQRSMSGCTLHFIQSGGIGTLADIKALAAIKDQSQLNGVIVGKAIYEGRFSVSQAQDLMRETTI